MKEAGETSIGVILAVIAIIAIGLLFMPAIMDLGQQTLDMMNEGVNNMDSFTPTP
jgi:hypothetical protein